MINSCIESVNTFGPNTTPGITEMPKSLQDGCYQGFFPQPVILSTLLLTPCSIYSNYSYIHICACICSLFKSAYLFKIPWKPVLIHVCQRFMFLAKAHGFRKVTRGQSRTRATAKGVNNAVIVYGIPTTMYHHINKNN